MATKKRPVTDKKRPKATVKDISHKFRLHRKHKNAAAPLPGVLSFTKLVFQQLWSERVLFLGLFSVSVIAALLLFGATQQDEYVTIAGVFKEYGTTLAEKGFGPVMQFGVLLATAASGGLNTTLTETQKVYFSLLYLLVWLTTIWLLRQRMAGVAVGLRDGLYNAAAPTVTTILLFFVGVLQMLPLALAVIIYSAAMSSGILHGPVEASFFALGAIMLGVLSLYWVSSTLIAVVIATNPGTYPLLALKGANRIVAGRRTGLVIRMIWLILFIAIVWVVALIPAVLIDAWIAQPLVPIVVVCVQLLSSFSVIFASSYIYLLYRKMIDESAK